MRSAEGCRGAVGAGNRALCFLTLSVYPTLMAVGQPLPHSSRAAVWVLATWGAVRTGGDW